MSMDKKTLHFYFICLVIVIIVIYGIRYIITNDWGCTFFARDIYTCMIAKDMK